MILISYPWGGCVESHKQYQMHDLCIFPPFQIVSKHLSRCSIFPEAWKHIKAEEHSSLPSKSITTDWEPMWMAGGQWTLWLRRAQGERRELHSKATSQLYRQGGIGQTESQRAPKVYSTLEFPPLLPLHPFNSGIDKQTKDLRNCHSQNQWISVYLLGLLGGRDLLFCLFLLSSYYVPGSVLSPEQLANKMNLVPAFMEYI